MKHLVPFILACLLGSSDPLLDSCNADQLTGGPTVSLAKMGPFSGKPIVASGDTLRFGTVRVKLYGIDAPDRGQCCHMQGNDVSCEWQVRQVLEKYLADKNVTCNIIGIDRVLKRPVGVCRTDDGADLSAMMVAAGMAADSPSTSGGTFAAAEATAKAAKRFLWNLGFVDPADWRAARMAGERLPTCDEPPVQ